jgi:S-formylglutathione hydrolase FrmB
MTAARAAGRFTRQAYGACLRANEEFTRAALPWPADVPVIASFVASILLLPGFLPVATGPAGGRVYAGTFPGTLRPGFVYLPPGFDPSRRYPVVYLLHGMPGSPSEYLSGTDLTQFADDGIASGRLRPFIAVAPAAGPDDRYDGEWAGPWEDALVGRVVPWIDAHLPTQADPSGRMIAGLSAGGFGAADIGVRHPDVFGTVLSFSGYFRPLHDGPFRHAGRSELRQNDPTLLVRSLRSQLARDGTRFFLSTGPAHSHWFTPGETIAFARELRSLDLPVTTYTHPARAGEWSAQVDAGLLWALRGK